MSTKTPATPTKKDIAAAAKPTTIAKKAPRPMLPPGKAKKAPSSTAIAVATGVHPRRRLRNYQSYSTFIYKLLKQVGASVKVESVGISKRAMDVMDSFVLHMFEMLADQARKLALSNKRQTITAREIQSAVQLMLPPDLARHAISEGTRAVTRYNASVPSSE